MSTLIVTLPYPAAGSAAVFDYVLSSDGHSLSAQGRATAALLPALPARGATVVALVPARALSWHQITLPGTMARALRGRLADQPRLRAVLAGLLEEFLLDEPEQLHFAVFPGAARDAPVWVAVCQRAWLLEALHTLAALPHRIQRIVPEYAPLPDAGAAATADVTADLAPAQLVLCTSLGVTVLPLGAAAAARVLQAAPPEIRAEPAVAALAEQTFGRAVRELGPGQRQLQAAQSDWNLAQFELSDSRRNRMLKALGLAVSRLARAPLWRPLRWGLALLLGVQVLGLNAVAWRERALLAEKKQALNALFSRSFPEVPVIVDAPLQMERAVALRLEAAGLGGGPGLVELFLLLAAAAPEYPVPTAIELQDGELRLQGTLPAAERVAVLSRQLAAQGWSARAQGEQLVLQPRGRP